MWANLNGIPVSVTSLISILVGLDMLGLAGKEAVAILILILFVITLFGLKLLDHKRI